MGMLKSMMDKLRHKEPERKDSGQRECKYAYECQQKCGHRKPHRRNNGCDNPCYHTGEICIEHDQDKTLGT